MIWTEEYSPKNLNDLIVEKPPVLKLQDFILNYSRHKKKAIMIYGPTGIGKTCSVYAIARENNLDVLEINSSDFRNKKNILDIFGGSVSEGSLFGRGKIILFDDVDGLSGTKDRGGIQAMDLLLKKSSFPIVITIKNPWEGKFSTLRNHSKMIEFKPLSSLEIIKVLKKICNHEKITITDDLLKVIAIKNSGDARSSINDLQSISFEKRKLSEEDVESLGYREKEESIFNLLKLIFKSTNVEIINNYVNSIDLNLNDISLWVEENIPKEYSGGELKGAFNFISKADVFKGRIRRNQYWRFLVYQKLFISSGVASVKTKNNSGFVKYSNPIRIFKIWKAKIKYSEKGDLAKKIASTNHLSSKKAFSEVIPYLRLISRKKEFVKEFDKQEINSLSY